MNSKKTYTVIGIVVLALLATIVVRSSGRQSAVPANTAAQNSSMENNTQGIADGPMPWPAEFAHLKARLASIGLPALTAEGTALHIHQHLDMLVNGVAVPVPPGIGIDPNDAFIAPVHVHDTTGIIHVESPTVETFTLGQFFDIWGLKLTGDCIGGYCTGGQASLQVYVNGLLYQGNPRDLALAAHQEIFLFYGTPDQLPKVIPSTFAFPAGY